MALFLKQSNADAKKHLIFISNPNSHLHQTYNLDGIVASYLDKKKFTYEICYSQSLQHAIELGKEAASYPDATVVVVGGDGLINCIGKNLLNTSTHLAIIPAGSGNGLARHLGIPLNPILAIKALNQSIPIAMDTSLINEHVFLSMAGIGYDAHVAKVFAQFGRRGFSSYLQIALREYAHYEVKDYLLTVDGKILFRKAFLISFANSSQYGNNFMIAPQAKVQDGKLNLVIIKAPPLYAVPHLLYRLTHGTLHGSPYVESYPCEKVKIKQKSIQAHIDGDPIEFHEEATIQIRPASLKIMVPKRGLGQGV